MGEFFKSWRRKTGCVTLVVALALMRAWLKSNQLYDQVVFRHMHSAHLQTSTRGYFNWRRTYGISDREQPHKDLPSGWRSFVQKKMEMPDMLHGKTIVWRRKGLGFDLGSGEYGFSNKMFGVASWTMPYWSVVVPLTLLSMILLLSKPRVAKPKKAVEPTTAEGA